MHGCRYDSLSCFDVIDKAFGNYRIVSLLHISSQSKCSCFLVQIVECRRVLKWTYAYGYYLPENEHTKRQFFEYSQGEAEAGLERLHQCAEKDLQTFLEGDNPTSSFNDFRTKLAGLTRCLHLLSMIGPLQAKSFQQTRIVHSGFYA